MNKTISFFCLFSLALIGQIFADSDDKNIICRQGKKYKIFYLLTYFSIFIVEFTVALKWDNWKWYNLSIQSLNKIKNLIIFIKKINIFYKIYYEKHLGWPMLFDIFFHFIHFICLLETSNRYINVSKINIIFWFI